MTDIVVYSTAEEIRDLTSRLAKDLKKGLSVCASNLTERLSDLVIDPAYRLKRRKVVADEGRFTPTLLLTKDEMYIGLYSPDREPPVVICLRGKFIQEVYGAPKISLD